MTEVVPGYYRGVTGRNEKFTITRTVDASDGNDLIYNTNLISTTYLSTFRLGAGSDILDFNSYRSNGDMTPVYFSAGTIIYGDTSPDLDVASPGADNDHIVASNSVDVIFAGGGNDYVNGQSGADEIFGGAGHDYILGGYDSDRLYGNAGNDVIYGGSPASVSRAFLSIIINYNGFNDTLIDPEVHAGKPGLLAPDDASEDYLDGGDGNDILIGGAGADKLVGGAGRDTASYATATAGVVASLAKPGSNRGDAQGDTYASIENLTGSKHADTLTGNGAANVLDGGSGKDTLIGGAGKDTLKGGSAADRLNGGTGADTLHGGTGADTFVFKTLKDSTVAKTGRDTIEDFSRAQGDKIDLGAIDANASRGGNQAFAFIGTDKFHKKVGELRYEKKDGDTFVHGDVNGDGKADFSIRFDAAITFQKGDFIL